MNVEKNHLSPNYQSLFQWNVTDDPHIYDDEAQISFGIRLNPSSAFSMLSKGPVADVPEVSCSIVFIYVFLTNIPFFLNNNN